MEDYSVKQRVQIVKLYYKNRHSVRETFRALRDFYPLHKCPAESIIESLVAKFEATGSIHNQGTPLHDQNATSAENGKTRTVSAAKKKRKLKLDHLDLDGNEETCPNSNEQKEDQDLNDVLIKMKKPAAASKKGTPIRPKRVSRRE